MIQEIWKERRKELWGEGFALTDLIRNQQSVERKEYDGKITVGDKEISVKGHTIISLPDNTPFVPNSKYYLFRIPEKEGVTEYRTLFKISEIVNLRFINPYIYKIMRVSFSDTL